MSAQEVLKEILDAIEENTLHQRMVELGFVLKKDTENRIEWELAAQKSTAVSE